MYALNITSSLRELPYLEPYSIRPPKSPAGSAIIAKQGLEREVILESAKRMVNSILKSAVIFTLLIRQRDTSGLRKYFN